MFLFTGQVVFYCNQSYTAREGYNQIIILAYLSCWRTLYGNNN